MGLPAVSAGDTLGRLVDCKGEAGYATPGDASTTGSNMTEERSEPRERSPPRACRR
jgi:hypothetical protein